MGGKKTKSMHVSSAWREKKAPKKLWKDSCKQCRKERSRDPTVASIRPSVRPSVHHAALLLSTFPEQNWPSTSPCWELTEVPQTSPCSLLGRSANGQLLLFWGLCRQMSLLCLQPHTSLSPLGSCRGQGSMCNVENSMSSREPLWWQPCQEQTLTS